MTAPAIRLGSGRATALVVVGEAATAMAMAVAALAATAVLADETARRRAHATEGAGVHLVPTCR